MEIMRQADPVGTVLDLQITQRQPCSVSGPLSLWHIDGNHKHCHQTLIGYITLAINVCSFLVSVCLLGGELLSIEALMASAGRSCA